MPRTASTVQVNAVVTVVFVMPKPTEVIKPTPITQLGTCPAATNAYLPRVDTPYGPLPDQTYFYVYSAYQTARVYDLQGNFRDFTFNPTFSPHNTWLQIPETRHWICVDNVGTLFAWYGN